MTVLSFAISPWKSWLNTPVPKLQKKSLIDSLTIGTKPLMPSKMGPLAEPPVKKLITHLDPGVRSSACEILKEVGTMESLDELKKVSRIRAPLSAAMLKTRLKPLASAR